MLEFFNQHLNTIVYVLLTLASGFIGLVLLFNSKLGKQSDRIARLETSRDDIERRLEILEKSLDEIHLLQQKLVSLRRDVDYISSSDKLNTLIEKISQLTTHLQGTNATSQINNQFSDSEKPQKPIVKTPIIDISTKVKPKPERKTV